ncbi:GDSL esterase/lipase At1g71250-like [Cynara cardunculus var. scolymus]|uniref:GDSL esterase/lipase At1g71250-like n=1 Tax=Cynara cardunculus var. scolymus TaxID=59895 RepID=UPI000D62FBDC|nr:GDSL esterase/lipase At1g71250-like [Cynara cardunculus var. scolymus]
MSEQTRSCPKAKYEPISLIMGSTFSIQDPQGVSATASIVPIFYVSIMNTKLMGHKKSPQPYLFLSKGGLMQMLRGVNFASGAAGLLDLTGQDLNIVSMSEQIKQFETIYGNLTLVKGRHATKTLLARSMFAVSVGSNDLFGYFESRSTVDPVIFINSLMTAYGCHINALYNLGARKFGIIGVPPIGCCPSQRIHNGTGGCLEIENTFARAFHSALDALMKQLASKLPEMKYALGNSYEMTINVINQAQLFNFKSVDTACCGEGWLNAEKTCTPEANMCSNRDEYLFWDLYHPTQYAAELAAMTLYNGGPQFVTPINFAQLVAY